MTTEAVIRAKNNGLKENLLSTLFVIERTLCKYNVSTDMNIESKRKKSRESHIMSLGVTPRASIVV